MKTRKKIIGIVAFAFSMAVSFGALALQTNGTEVAADAEAASFAMVEGAQVRTEDPSGIRFATNVNAAYKASLAATYPTDTYTYVWGTELTYTDAAGAAQKIEAETKKWLDGESGWYTALVDIPATDYLTEITAKSYVKIYADAAKTELKETKWVENAQTRSIAYSASWALNDGYDADILYTYTKAIPDTSVTLDKQGVAYVSKGEEIQLTATGNANYGIAWRSSNPSVATVDKTGKVKTVGAGLATITATLGNSKASYQVGVDYTKIDFEDGQVSPVIGSELTVLASKDTATVPVGTTFGMTVSKNDKTALISEGENKAFGTEGLENVQTAKITVDWDWLNYAFSNQNVVAVTLDFYTSYSFAWVQQNNTYKTYKAMEIRGSDVDRNVRKFRYSVMREDFESATQNQDLEISFRYAGGMGFVYVDNLTPVTTEKLYENCLVTSFARNATTFIPLNSNNKVNFGDVTKSLVYGTSAIGTNNSATMYATLSSAYMGLLFADEKVNAITFDMIISINNKVVKINNKAIDKTITVDETLGGYVYHITITREMYESYGTGTDIEMCYTQGDIVNNSYQPSTFFYVDNLALVKQ